MSNLGFKTPQDVLKYIKDNDVKFVDVRFCDLPGVQQHFNMPIESVDDMVWLKERSSLPLFADESCKRLSDIENVSQLFHGINIKLMKSTGLLEAYKMINKARSLSLKIMIGCMSESSVGILAASSLAPLCDYADLDSVWMVSNNPFETPALYDGKIRLGLNSGVGYQKKIEL